MLVGIWWLVGGIPTTYKAGKKVVANISYEEKEEWLKRYYDAMCAIEHLTEELLRLRSVAEKITPTLSQTPGGGSGQRIQDAVEKIVMQEEELNKELTQAQCARREIQQAIAAVKNPKQRMVLRYRYFKGMTLEEIAEKMEWSVQWTSIQHKKAVESLRIKEENKYF